MVELMSAVAVGLRPSAHAAFQAAPAIRISVQALYDKFKRTDPGLVRTLVRRSAERWLPVAESICATPLPTLKGYRVRIIDGNHLPASEKRLKPLRTFRSAALPRQSLVVSDPASPIVTDVVPCKDAHARAGELWIGDRNSSAPARFWAGLHPQQIPDREIGSAVGAAAAASPGETTMFTMDTTALTRGKSGELACIPEWDI
jgi:hypothetical protein